MFSIHDVTTSLSSEYRAPVEAKRREDPPRRRPHAAEQSWPLFLKGVLSAWATLRVCISISTRCLARGFRVARGLPTLRFCCADFRNLSGLLVEESFELLPRLLFSFLICEGPISCQPTHLEGSGVKVVLLHTCSFCLSLRRAAVASGSDDLSTVII